MGEKGSRLTFPLSLNEYAHDNKMYGKENLCRHENYILALQDPRTLCQLFICIQGPSGHWDTIKNTISPFKSSTLPFSIKEIKNYLQKKSENYLRQ